LRFGRRTDISAARWRIEAATSDIRSAEAQFSQHQSHRIRWLVEYRPEPAHPGTGGERWDWACIALAIL
jgi:hypothetical protein